MHSWGCAGNRAPAATLKTCSHGTLQLGAGGWARTALMSVQEASCDIRHAALHPGGMDTACVSESCANLLSLTAGLSTGAAPHLSSMATALLSQSCASLLWLSICMKMSSFLYKEATFSRATVGPLACRQMRHSIHRLSCVQGSHLMLWHQACGLCVCQAMSQAAASHFRQHTAALEQGRCQVPRR